MGPMRRRFWTYPDTRYSTKVILTYMVRVVVAIHLDMKYISHWHSKLYGTYLFVPFRWKT
ncbi:hypothetical protein BDZ94DRAFT_1262854 [Collybia nuda]|uniref:Uncharacterized protein n=1 Tax=Collybia nuda TaxID=64659 RepID=A0A9P5Y432_9AGAR|nr:hypothetical protein BDZ94DRAFT_1262854 [Collybia nuda]